MLRILHAVGLLALACLTCCITPERHRELLMNNNVLRDQIDDLKRANKDYQAEADRLGANVIRLEGLAKNAGLIDRQKEQLRKILAQLGGGVPGVETETTGEGLVMRVQGAVLFDSGSATLSKSGKVTLRRLDEAVRSHSGFVRVDGHTDKDPIAHSKWGTNMRLSVARSLAVRDFLVGAGVPREKLSVAGYGEFRPVDSDDKDKSRRVEIVLLRGS